MNVQRLGILGVLAIVVSGTVLCADEPAVVLENGDFSFRLGSTGRNPELHRPAYGKRLLRRARRSALPNGDQSAACATNPPRAATPIPSSRFDSARTVWRS